MSDNVYYIKEDTLTDIADAIREGLDSEETITPLQMANRINQIKHGPCMDPFLMASPDDEDWVRPNDWPDLDNITIEDGEDVCYFTYDLRKTPGYGWIGFVVSTSSGTVDIDRGHIANHAFVVDDYYTAPGGAYFRLALDSTNGDVQLWRVKATNPNSHVIGCYFCSNSGTTSECYNNMLQPCVERKGYFDYATPCGNNSGQNYNSVSHGTYWLEHDGLVMAREVAMTGQRQGWWSYNYRLRKIDLDKWDTSKWKITQFRTMFYYCHSLKKLDMSGWDTSHWELTSVSYCFAECNALSDLRISNWNTSNWKLESLEYFMYNCRSLIELDFSNWDTSGWIVSNFARVWHRCLNLRTLKIGNWDTSGWHVTTLANTWYQLWNLEELEIENWDTRGWAVTSLSYTFGQCFSLIKLDLSKWVTTNWEVTTLGYTWYQEYNLKELNIQNWNTSNWAVTSLQATWAGCYSLRELNIQNWNTSNWAVTTLASTWGECRSLRQLKLNNWDTSNWVVTSLGSTFAGSCSLTSIEMDEWDTTNWAVTTLSQMFSECTSLQEVDLSDWDTSNWAVTTLYYLFYWCQNLRKIDWSTWDTTNWAVTTNQYMFNQIFNLETALFPATFNFTSSSNNSAVPNIQKLKNYSGYAIAQNHSYNNSICLTTESLVSILNRLSTVSSTKTLTLGQCNKNKLTAEQIAIATQKGWTVA